MIISFIYLILTIRRQLFGKASQLLIRAAKKQAKVCQPIYTLDFAGFVAVANKETALKIYLIYELYSNN